MTNTKPTERKITNPRDLSIQRLDEMVYEVASLFLNEKVTHAHLYWTLLRVLSFRIFFLIGGEKKELIELFTRMVDDSLDELAEFKKA